MLLAQPKRRVTTRDARTELEELDRCRSRLGESLVNAASQLEQLGVAPSDELVHELELYRERMEQLVDQFDLAKGADSEDVLGSPTIDDVRRLIHRRKFQEITDAMVATLSGLTHVDTPDFPPLTQCLQAAMQLRDLTLSNVGDEIEELESLCEGHHPLHSFLQLLDNGDHLSDAEWSQYNEEVASHYGRPLATALARGHIQRVQRDTENTPGPSDDSRHVATVPEGAEIQREQNSSDTGKIQSTSISQLKQSSRGPIDPESNNRFEHAFDTESVFDVPRVRDSASRMELSKEEISRDNSPSQASAAVSASPTIDESNRQKITDQRRATTDGNRSGSVTHLTEHVAHLMEAGRLPIALHLQQCLELRPKLPAAYPPAWLLRALILGRNLGYSKGNNARQLDDELRNFRPDMLADDGTDRARVIGLLLRAAALPAALLGGSAPAAQVLRAIKMTPGFSQLYNYCSRVSLYSDRIAGNLQEIIRPPAATAGDKEQVELGRIAGDWLQETARKVASYARTSPLFLHAHWTLTAGTAVRYSEVAQFWCKWQETLSLVRRLLKPVCEQREGERAWVKQEIVRLSANICVENPESTSRNRVPEIKASRGVVLRSEEMQRKILEGINIANRWLHACNQTGSQGTSAVPVEAFELRDELLQRSDGVLNELSQHRSANSPPLVKAAIACCQETVLHIQALLKGDRSLPLTEPESRHIFNAELLKIPQLELNEQWIPDVEPEELQAQLLVWLEGGEIGWQQAYEIHAQNENYEATGRLLDLDIWPDPGEREALRQRRQTQVAFQRELVAAEIKDLAANADTMAESEGLNTLERGALARRIERMRCELPRVTNFGSFRRQLDQIRSVLLRQRDPQGVPVPPASGLQDRSKWDTDWKEQSTKASISDAVTDEIGTDHTVLQAIDIFSGE